ncbi:MAG: PD-(D/E)XK nuclease family protein [Lentisphaerota bacterium]
MELKNRFSWSKSRDENFRECLRKYYFHYYGYWGGWKLGADPRTREIYVLKKLASRPVWAGDHVHRAIHRVLEQHRLGNAAEGFEQARDGMLERMRKEFRDSRQGLYRNDPKAHCGLFDHEYQIPTPPETWKETADQAAQHLESFFLSEVYGRLKNLPAADWLEIEELASFDLNGLAVFVQLDCALRENNRTVIFDWKTGASQEGGHNIQMACYALYAMSKWKVPPEEIVTAEVNLASGAIIDYPVHTEMLEDIKGHIHDSAEEMLFPLDDPENNIAIEEAFDCVEDETPCHRCNFLKVCPKWR